MRICTCAIFFIIYVYFLSPNVFFFYFVSGIYLCGKVEAVLDSSLSRGLYAEFFGEDKGVGGWSASDLRPGPGCRFQTATGILCCGRLLVRPEAAAHVSICDRGVAPVTCFGVKPKLWKLFIL